MPPEVEGSVFSRQPKESIADDCSFADMVGHFVQYHGHIMLKVLIYVDKVVELENIFRKKIRNNFAIGKFIFFKFILLFWR